MKYLVLALCLVSLPACSHNPPVYTTPQAQHADTGVRVVARFKEVSDVVQAGTGTQPGQIRPADAFTIIEWISGDAHATPPTTGIVQLVEVAADQGWKATALASWSTRIRPIFARYPKLAPYVDIIDALLQEVH